MKIQACDTAAEACSIKLISEIYSSIAGMIFAYNLNMSWQNSDHSFRGGVLTAVTNKLITSAQ